MKEMDTEIEDIRKEAESYQHRVREMKLALHIVKTLHTNAEKTLASLSELSGTLIEDPDFQLSTSPMQRMVSIGKGLSETHTTHLNTAQAVLEQAIQEHQRIEVEIDANRSLYHCINHSLTSRIDLRTQVDDNIRRMKDLLSPRRRIPNELWSLIFWERVMEDEDEYEDTWREEKPPFPTLKLTWVCRSWRKIATDQSTLWQYIALPRTLHLSPVQADRVKYFLERLNGLPPTFYMVFRTKSAENNGVHFQTLFSPLDFPSIRRFEAQIPLESDSVPKFLNSIGIPIEDLVLISSSKGEEHEHDLILPYDAIKAVKSLECYGIHPCIDQSLSNEEQGQLDSLHLSIYEVNNEQLILFLETSGAAALTVDPRGEWSIDEEGEIERDALLTRLNTISIPLPVLKFAFNQHVLVPDLHTLTLNLFTSFNIDESLDLWTSFLSVHERGTKITTLGISGVPDPEEEPPEKMSAMLSKLINTVPNIADLTLKGKAVVPSLQGMADSKQIPPGIVTLKISDCDDVTEDLIITFLTAYYANQRGPLFLEIVSCASISEDAEQRLDLAQDEFEDQGKEEVKDA
jgi:hypothetical protein